MKSFLAMAALAVVAVAENTFAADHWLGGKCRPGNSIRHLGESLSRNAQIYFPWSDGFTEQTQRWSTFNAPHVTLVTVPATEEDVAKIIRFANARRIPYLAVNLGHGTIASQGNMKHGIEIRLHELNSIKIARDGKTVTVGGGTISKDLIDALWDAGKQTVTGGCECTSLLGPGLGGGHGYLQGRYGLITDQFVSMNIVTADGHLQTIDEKSELWWAMKGAGHNFGIVTSATSKIHDIENRVWAYESFIFTGDKVEEVYDSLNRHVIMNGSQPVDIINHSLFLNIPDIDPKNPVILLYIAQEGTEKVDRAYTKHFHNIGPVSTDGKFGDYINIPKWVGNDIDSAACQITGDANYRFPIELHSYNIATQRQVYDMFAAGLQKMPELQKSMFFFEGYSMQGVRDVARESTAFAFRDDNVSVAPLITYKPAGRHLDKKAVEFGESLRKALYNGTGRKEMHSYVNYAFGEESKQNIYGYEQWRQDRLLSLKDKYDPHRRFSFYAPIA